MTNNNVNKQMDPSRGGGGMGVEVVFHTEAGDYEVTPESLIDHGRIIAPGLVLLSGDGETDIYAYDKREGNRVHCSQDNHALFSFSYLVGNEKTQEKMTHMIREGISVVDWIRAAVNLNDEINDAYEGGAI